jgi:conjugal transfer pilus assembly protein TraV
LFNHAKPLLLSLSALAMLSGCSSMLNTAGSGDYSCPGMPNGVVCKTPSAVYRSTHLDSPITEFDTPIGSPALSEPAEGTGTGSSVPTRVANAAARSFLTKTATGPRPVREPATVARIWIAPWVDKQDNLHLAETQYTEIKPRTWTVGKPEVAASTGYLIPHRAYEGIAVPGDAKNERGEMRPSDGPPSGNSQAKREANTLVAPPN